MFSKKLSPEEKYYKNMEQMQKKLHNIEKQNSKSRQGYKQHYNNEPKKGGGFLGLIAAALFMAAGFYIFTITVPKIGGEEFELEKVTSIVDVVQTGKLPEKKEVSNQEDTQADSEERSTSEKLANLEIKDIGVDKAISEGGDVAEKGKVVASGFMAKIMAMFSKKEKVIEDKQPPKAAKKQTIQKIEPKIEQRVVLDEKLKEKNKKNEKGEITNDLSYYQK